MFILAPHTFLYCPFLIHYLSLLILFYQRFQLLDVQVLGGGNHGEEELVVEEDHRFVALLKIEEKCTTMGLRFVLIFEK